MNGCSFQQVSRLNLGWFLYYHWKTIFLRGFNLKPKERAQVLLKTVLGNFKIALCLRDQHVLLWKSVKILNLFNNLTLKQILWKIKAFFKKTGVSFLVESTKIENASFPYKTAISEANGKTNSMGTTKWNTEQMDHKEQSFSSNYLIFF